MSVRMWKIGTLLSCWWKDALVQATWETGGIKQWNVHIPQSPAVPPQHVTLEMHEQEYS